MNRIQARNPAKPARFPDDDARWAAVQRRDPAADGAFYVAVRTTGVYCRPSCAGRPLRKNVAFHESPDAAEADGFRPCKRCRPRECAPAAAGPGRTEPPR